MNLLICNSAVKARYYQAEYKLGIDWAVKGIYGPLVGERFDRIVVAIDEETELTEEGRVELKRMLREYWATRLRPGAKIERALTSTLCVVLG